MQNNIRNTNLRFNLAKEQQRKAWEYLQTIQDLDLLTIGMLNDMYAESSNDEYKDYAQIATQIDFDAF